MRGVRAALPALLASAAKAGEVEQAIPDAWWDGLYDRMHKDFLVDRAKDPITATGYLDRLCGLPETERRRTILELGKTETGVLTSALAELDAGDLEAALQAFGVKPWQLSNMTKRANGLLFNTVVDSLMETPLLGRLAKDARRPLALLLARHIETTIKEAE